MTAAQYCKSQGVTLAQVSRLTGKSRQTLGNWFTWQTDLFKVVVAGAVAIRSSESASS